MTAVTGSAVTFRRGFAPGDLPAVVALHTVYYGPRSGWDAVDLEAYVASTMADLIRHPDGGALFVAEIDGEVVGSCGITRDSADVARLRWYIVREDAHGFGIGKRLLDDAIRFCRDEGYERVWLSTAAGLPESTHRYTAAGFVLTEEFDSASWGEPVREQRYDLVL